MRTELLDAYLTGELRGESATFIESALKSDAALREVYFQQVRIDAALRVLLEDEELSEVSPDQFARGVMATLESDSESRTSEPDRLLAKSVLTEILDEQASKPRPMSSRELGKAAGIAAAAAAAVILLLKQVDVSDPQDGGRPVVPGDQRFVAQITSQQEGTSWGDPEPLHGETNSTPAGGLLPVMNDDGWMRPGRFTLEAGVAEVTFNSGARVFLEGPAVFDVEQPDRAFLQSGKLTAEVPKPASGFVINTPRVNVVDIGTRFGVDVESNGDTEVHVMQGVVEVSRLTGNGAPMIVEEGLAVRADGRTRSELQVVEYGGDRFALRVTHPESDPSTPVSYLHYAFDESGGSEIDDLGVGIEGGPFFASLFPQTNLPPRPQRGVGRLGGGLSFEHGERFDSPLLSGFESGAPITVGLWVRIPPRPESPTSSHAILELLPTSAAFPEEPGTTNRHGGWRLGWNAESAEGTPGALRLDTGNSYLIGTSDLRDGRWHHVAFRFVGGPSPALISHLHLYVDGKIEDVSGWQEDDLSFAPLQRLLIGGAADRVGFEGMVDELHLFPNALEINLLQQLAAGENLR